MDTSTPYFFRVHEFVFVTPPSANKIVLGIVLSVARRGQGTINNIRIALEGCPEPVTVSPSICQFPLEEIDNDDLVLAETRANVSCAMRFSEPPISIQAQDELVNHARRFLPAHPAESILPLRVLKPTQADMDWIADRRGAFLSYKTQPGSSRKRMAQLFSMACSALAATNVMVNRNVLREWMGAHAASRHLDPELFDSGSHFD
ncbi:hypothetical protein ANCCAN_17103 [Ancylostoma caninum]|uniref:Uncharacterized protein n=1 Tax=Ancylostoma caninum TaxID=29170 RepID=A0A368G181_ANCCA|nr:hypothetical protein ANCCAN_17103 [Ancylostoma caninum]